MSEGQVELIEKSVRNFRKQFRGFHQELMASLVKQAKKEKHFSEDGMITLDTKIMDQVNSVAEVVCQQFSVYKELIISRVGCLNEEIAELEVSANFFDGE